MNCWYKPSSYRQTRANIERLRAGLLKDICRIYRHDVQLSDQLPACSKFLFFPKSGIEVSVHTSACIPTRSGEFRWDFRVDNSRKRPTLFARCNPNHDGFVDLWVMPPLEQPTRFRIKQNDPWLLTGRRIEKLAQLHKAAKAMLHSQ
jgi:hypothetical protein